MKKYKVLSKDLKSPFKQFQYQIGKEYVCEDFDESNKECSTGFYATDIEGLLYCFNNSEANEVFEVEVSGKSKVFDQFKQRYEKQTIIREILTEELKELIKVESDKLSYDLYHAIYPFNPLKGEVKEVTQEIKDLFDEWINVQKSVWNFVRDSVRESVWYSVLNSVGYSVRDSVLDSVRHSVWDSPGDSVWNSVDDVMYAYIGSLFPEVKKWRGIEHEEGVYPFPSGLDLWNTGFVPSYDGLTWRLYSGENVEIIYEKNI